MPSRSKRVPIFREDAAAFCPNTFIVIQSRKLLESFVVLKPGCIGFSCNLMWQFLGTASELQ